MRVQQLSRAERKIWCGAHFLGSGPTRATQKVGNADLRSVQRASIVAGKSMPASQVCVEAVRDHRCVACKPMHLSWPGALVLAFHDPANAR
jgi:hypothetical protein